MRFLIKIKLLISVGILVFGCQDILVEDPPSNISLQSFYQSEDDAITGLNGAYVNLYSVYGNNSSILYGELNADNLTISPIVPGAFAWDNFTYNSDVTGSLWAQCFSGINRANEVIKYTADIDFEAGRKADLIAEAKALRALYYFQLVRPLGGVPIYEEPTVGFDEIYNSRNSEQEVYDLIIRDLNGAVNELAFTSLAGRINSNIAASMLARVYLYTGDFANALNMAKKVIGTNSYRLLADYANVFKPDYNNSAEHIFQIQYLSGERNNQMGPAFGPRAPAGPYNGSFWAGTIVPGNFAPSVEFIADNPQSYRRSATIADSYEHIDGVTGTITMQEVYDGVFPYYINKFDDRPAELQSGANFSVIRYADILLIAAEASNEVDPSGNDKYTWINMVRARARNGVDTDLPDLVGLSQDEFREAVLEERRFELAFEGERAWDLKRRGQFLEKVRAQGKSVEDFMLMFPIPDRQTVLNTNLSQNDGWD